jgi:hypothetical protein
MASRSPPAITVAIVAPPSTSTTQEEELVMPEKIKTWTNMRTALRT